MTQTARFQFWQCTNPACRLRFPAEPADPRATLCPLCAARTAADAPVVTAATVPDRDPGPHRRIVAVLDNVRSMLNVGSIFRSADGAGIDHLYLCGITATPEQPKVAKTALGAEQSVGWSHHRNAVDVVVDLRQAGADVWGVERTDTSVALGMCAVDSAETPLALIIGHERAGIDPALLDLCHRTVHIPMRGVKRSLNVAVAFGIVAYHCTSHWTPAMLNQAEI